MEPKAELLVFNKKEVAVIVILLVLVALFSFTLGLRLGRTLGATQNKGQATETAPLAEKKEAQAPSSAEEGEKPAEHAAAPAEAAKPAEKSHEETAQATAEHGSAEGEKAKGEAVAQGEDESQKAQGAENKADDEFAKEAEKQKAGPGKAVPMSLPSEKKGALNPVTKTGSAAAGFTLQVGSHRTVAEAAEQVSGLKRGGLDAFYVEAKVPGKGTWYRVGIGFYPTKEAAERAAGKLKAAKKPLPSFIVQKINE